MLLNLCKFVALALLLTIIPSSSSAGYTPGPLFPPINGSTAGKCGSNDGSKGTWIVCGGGGGGGGFSYVGTTLSADTPTLAVRTIVTISVADVSKLLVANGVVDLYSGSNITYSVGNIVIQDANGDYAVIGVQSVGGLSGNDITGVVLAQGGTNPLPKNDGTGSGDTQVFNSTAYDYTAYIQFLSPCAGCLSVGSFINAGAPAAFIYQTGYTLGVKADGTQEVQVYFPTHLNNHVSDIGLQVASCTSVTLRIIAPVITVDGNATSFKYKVYGGDASSTCKVYWHAEGD